MDVGAQNRLTGQLVVWRNLERGKHPVTKAIHRASCISRAIPGRSNESDFSETSELPKLPDQKYRTAKKSDHHASDSILFLNLRVHAVLLSLDEGTISIKFHLQNHGYIDASSPLNLDSLTLQFG